MTELRPFLNQRCAARPPQPAVRCATSSTSGALRDLLNQRCAARPPQPAVRCATSSTSGARPRHRPTRVPSAGTRVRDQPQLPPPVVDRLDGEHREREPDQAEADPPAGRHRLVEDEQARARTGSSARGTAAARGHHRDPDGRGAEQHQRDGGDDAGGGEQERVAQPVRAEVGVAAQTSHTTYAAPPGRGRGLDRDALDRAHAGLLLEQTVGAEGEGQHERDPGRSPVVDRQHDDRHERDHHGDPLERTQPLAEDQHAHQDGHQGVDEVAERGLHDAPVVDAPDVAAPVERDDDGGEQMSSSLRRSCNSARSCGTRRHSTRISIIVRQRPHDPVGEDLDGTAGLEQGPVERERAPQHVGQCRPGSDRGGYLALRKCRTGPSPTMGAVPGSAPRRVRLDRFSRGNHHADVPHRPGSARRCAARHRSAQHERQRRVHAQAHHRRGLAARATRSPTTPSSSRATVTEPQLDGTALPYANQKVKILKKKCGTCKWKIVKKVKTNDNGIFKTRIYAPEQGRWKWRSKVDHSNGYGNTKGKVWTLSSTDPARWRIRLTQRQTTVQVSPPPISAASRPARSAVSPFAAAATCSRAGRRTSAARPGGRCRSGEVLR